MDAVDWHQQLGRRFEEGYERSRAFRERLEVWSDLIRSYSAPGADVLDAGCGPGVLAGIAARMNRSVHGFDASSEMVALARARAGREQIANATFEVASLGDPQLLAGRTFGLVLCSSVLEYIADIDTALDWLAARTTDGGVFILSLPNGRSLYRRAERLVFGLIGRPRYYAHVRHTPLPETVDALLERRGFLIEARHSYAGTPLISAPARRIGLAQYADNLLVAAARKGRR
ncbi:Methyltransferase type 11 [Rhodovulum sp. PH10]|uniref:class I SAM-dependent methyltransferase n=1 Tax=Rhodovulum sp. PH10 TaxID=1187851 RepID=UPI00027C1EB2|nr:methyltransferase domain-containing protein [Rhodovulum sp. PH10]EJW09781.1 Methyltransferase type 11 [Rhodovulum sp. PH10]